jgi:DNA polymerase-3 subunit alpha
MLKKGDFKAAEKSVDEYLKIFGKDNYFIEIQNHGDDDKDIRDGLIELAKKKGVELVAANDVHFLDENDYEAHNCLCCISTGKTTDDPTRMIYPESVFFKSPEQMRQLFADVPQACDNTLKIAERCNIEIDLSTRHAPRFNPPDGKTPEDFLTELCYEGAKQRYGEITDEIKQRIERELDVIEGKGFSSYFLINWEFCKWAHDNNIPVGARGSGVGTIVGYCLGLCDIDPVKYDLLFERFMDPERDEMPDIDIDMCQQNRPRLIEYVREKYGQVAQIITFGTMKARAVIRDVCRVKNVPLSEADRIAKLIPDSLGVTLDDALETEPDLKKIYNDDEQIRSVIDIAKKLEGLTRHASVHAAGVVIADEPLTNFIPLYKAADSDDIVTQFEGPTVEKVGLLKMDFLGLKTLSVLERARQLIKINHGNDINLEKIDIHDSKVFELFRKGMTKGVFQFESGGMQDMLMKMKPDRLEDLIAANALYRPGPMSLIPDYIDRKHGAAWSTPHPVMQDVLKETFGIMIYQEQVMRIANRLGKIPLRQAYTMIKAISKKKTSVIAEGKEKFLKGAKDEGLTKTQGEEIWELIERFAGYGFNKSHSARYAFVAYQTAYLKAYWPIEFMAALLTYEMGNTDKVVDYIGECKKMGIEVSPPDINESGVDFTPLYKGKGENRSGVIRFGLTAVKGVGEKAVKRIIEFRQKVGKFHSLFHFCESVDLRAVNKSTIESLIKAGAFDRLGGNRAQMLAGLEDAIKLGMTTQDDKQTGQMNFFAAKDESDYANDQKALPDVAPWPEAQMLAYEKSVIGFYVTSNPLSRHAETIDAYSTVNTKKLDKCPQDEEIAIGGMITKIRQHITKKGRNAGSKMGVFVLEDLQGTAEVVLFPESFSKNAELITEDRVVFVKGKVDKKRENPNIIADDIIPIEEAAEKLAARVQLKLDSKQITDKKITAIKTICSRYRGKSDVCVTIQTPKGKVYATADKSFSVNPQVDFCKEIKRLVGEENFRITK